MHSYNTQVYSEIVKKNDKVLRWWAEWIIDAPTYGARLIRYYALNWLSSERGTVQVNDPGIYAILQRHFAGDAELEDLKKRLNVQPKVKEQTNA